MNAFSVERVEKRPPDLVFLAVLVTLAGVGLSMLFSSSYFRADHLFSDPLYFFRRQFIWVLLGSASAVVAARIPLALLQKSVPLQILVSFVLMVMTFVPGIGAQFLGARRWIFLFGYSFQPSELVKLTAVIYLAYILARKREAMDDAVNSLLPPVIVVGIFATLIYLQNDFSTSVFLIFIAVIMFFIAGVPIRYFLSLIAMVTPLSVLLLLTREHRVMRLLAFLDPTIDPSGTGYQVLAAKRALLQGGLWGAGIGQSSTKFGNLPEAHSDFVFAVVGEETGLLGILLVIALFALFAYRGYLIAVRSKDAFSSYLAFGLTTCVVFQALLNMAVVSGLVPATGIPLPFFSSGGSSVFVTLAMCGLLLNLSRHQDRTEEELYG